MFSTLIGKILTPLGVGVVSGIYIDQNYNVPKINGYIKDTAEFIKKTEEELRKGDEKGK